MKDERPKRLFSRKTEETSTKSLRCPYRMWDLLEEWGEANDETANAWIVLLLDGILQARAKKGAIELTPEEKQLLQVNKAK